MNRRAKRNLLACALLITSLSICVFASSASRAARTQSLPVLPSTPSDFLGLVILSGFRPVAVDVLWVRAEDLARERRYYELLWLYRLITTLDPHFESAWTYNATNLAFRLAELESSPQRRWLWTREALLYAMEGMERNPASDKIAAVIAFIYYFRVARDEHMLRQFLEDPVLNPGREPVIALARYWAERGFQARPHTIYIDWLLEFIYGDYAAHASVPADRLEYLNRRLEVWRCVLADKPYSASKAAQKMQEIQAEISRLQPQAPPPQ